MLVWANSCDSRLVEQTHMLDCIHHACFAFLMTQCVRSHALKGLRWLHGGKPVDLPHLGFSPGGNILWDVK